MLHIHMSYKTKEEKLGQYPQELTVNCCHIISWSSLYTDTRTKWAVTSMYTDKIVGEMRWGVVLVKCEHHLSHRKNCFLWGFFFFFFGGVHSIWFAPWGKHSHSRWSFYTRNILIITQITEELQWENIKTLILINLYKGNK